jgi:hypothetical protein
MPARLDFKQLAQDIDITDVARLLGVTLSKDMRATCCGSERSLQIFPETNSFRCHSAQLSGDCISFYAHIKGFEGMYKAARELSELFRVSGIVPTVPDKATVPSTPPQKKPERGKQPAPFDPTAFATKLSFSDEVKALANERDAANFRVGVYRGHLYIPAIYPSGAIAGWWKLVDGKLVPPEKWLPDTSNIVPLRRPA